MAVSSSFTLKLERAREHLKVFEEEARVWIETEPHRVIDEPNPEPPTTFFDGRDLDGAPLERRRFRVVHIDPIPDRLALLIGDCVFNARAALDHLALALAMFHTPSMTAKQIETSEFPIFAAVPKDSKIMDRKIGCINPAATAIIEALQPHHRGTGFGADPLWQLHELNRIDKHRVLTVCSAVARRQGENLVGFKVAQGRPPRRFGGMIQSIGGEVKADAVLFKYSVFPPEPGREVNVQPHIPLEITFSQGGPAALESVVPALQAILDFVRDTVITPLSKFF